MAGHSEDKGSGNGLFLHRHKTDKENELLASAEQTLVVQQSSIDG